MNNNDNIDKELFDALNDASMDAAGIDWKAFENHKKKKKRRAFLWFAFTGLFLVTAIISSILFFDERQENKAIANVQSNNQLLNKKEAPQKSSGALTPTAENTNSTKPGRDISRLDISPSENVSSGKKELSSKPYKKGSHALNTVPQTFKVEEKPSQTITMFEPDGINTVITAHKHDPNITSNLNLAPLHINKIASAPDKIQTIDPLHKQFKLDKSKRKSFFIEIQAGPAWNFPKFTLIDAGKNFIHKDYAGIRRSSEKGLGGYGFQLTGGIALRKMDIGFGLGISNTVVYGNYDFVYFEKPIINPDGTIAGYNSTTPSSVRYNSKQKYTFVEFPLYLNYQLYSKNKIKTSMHLGMVNQFLKNINGELPNALFMDHKDNLSTENFKTYSANMELGCRFAYQYNSRIQYAITPFYRKNFGFYQVMSYYKSNFNSIGIQFSVRAKL